MHLFFVALTLLMLLTMWFDAREYIIPNWLCGMVLALYPVMLWMASAPVEWHWGLAAFAGMFVLGYVLFALNYMGGGDAKLLAACALWAGVATIVEFTLYTALLGGALSVALLGARAVLKGEKLPRIFQKGAPVPYGLAIAAAFLILLWQGKLPGLSIPA